MLFYRSNAISFTFKNLFYKISILYLMILVKFYKFKEKLYIFSPHRRSYLVAVA